VNVLVIASDFNIRDSIWDFSFFFHSIYNNLLVNVTDFFDLMLSHPTNQVPTRYLDNINDISSVIDLRFLRPNFMEFDNYIIYPKF